MLAITLVAAVLAVTAAEGGPEQGAPREDSYGLAHQEMKESGRPLLVLVGADWCPGCQILKHTMKESRLRKFLSNRVAFAHVDKDSEQRLAGRLMQGDRIPQLILFRRTRNGWKTSRMIGNQPEVAVQEFVTNGIEEALPPEEVVKVEAAAEESRRALQVSHETTESK